MPLLLCVVIGIDVKFQRDPFIMVQWVGRGVLLVGRDMEVFQSMRSMDWMVKRVHSCFPTMPPLMNAIMDAPYVFNAGK